MTRLWHAVLALFAAAAVVGQTILFIDNDNSLVNLFSYFTIESNILMTIAAALIAIRPDRGGTTFGILRLGSLTAITITGIVYATVLAGTAEFTGSAWWYDKVLHYVVPAMSVIGFLAFKPRTKLDRDAMWFIVWPIAWLTYTLIRGAVSHPGFHVTTTKKSDVPYEFLDIDQHGAGFVTLACLIVLVLALGLAAGYRKLAQRIGDAELVA